MASLTPVDLNRCTAKQLVMLVGLPLSVASKLVRYRRRQEQTGGEFRRESTGGPAKLSNNEEQPGRKRNSKNRKTVQQRKQQSTLVRNVTARRKAREAYLQRKKSRPDGPRDTVTSLSTTILHGTEMSSQEEEEVTPGTSKTISLSIGASSVSLN